MMKKPVAKKAPFAAANKKPNALNKSIKKQVPLKSKNKNPGRYLDK